MTNLRDEAFEAMLRAAIDAHPDWENLADGTFRRDRNGKGPSTPDDLIKWFFAEHPKEAELILAKSQARIREADGRRHN